MRTTIRLPDDLLADAKRVAVETNTVGEAARAVSEATKQRSPEIPWPRIIGMRNIIAHQYFGIDAEVVWNVVERDLPVLKSQVLALLDQVHD
jgi:uncharacterized protein with HEPN domain